MLISMAQPDHDASCLYHILLLLESDTTAILAGVCFECYFQSNCGLVTYVATNPKIDTKGQVFGRFLVDNALEQLQRQGQCRRHMRCRAVFLESNSDLVVHDVMGPVVLKL
ncbi:hypothetical protein H257_16120 [Aphanomyces astaci]|uniref:N-acetyltransferase domain-containing protein n=1 Tax=Aphanomyces astaci TaxID=112090 RepID=W4FLJ0_APHAT|nr:hypothetical protein H257_16120 [Aphanomyces astaci]ETV67761.1 hypothetical protein H257_16120 [Aphanomyces astaci]|eukprot:XP_009842754.1 hypothetical protein H257_16120 [Aphanomyces astaci]